jgi:selenocysteine lyase/cysteine desulfurase
MNLLDLPHGAVRAGVVGYTTDEDVDRLLAALDR